MLPQGVTDGVSDGYDQLWRTFIKPMRLEYHEEDLGPWVSSFDQITPTDYGYFVRDDFRVKNGAHGWLAVSFYYSLHEQVNLSQQHLPADREGFIRSYDREATKDVQATSCLFYLHSQGGNRLEGRFLVESCSTQQVCLCLFDFSGCGLSTGEYVSLGLFEKLQVERVLQQVRDKYNVGSVGLWGRSMGAVTAILFAEMRPFDVCAVVVPADQVLDSPFGSMKKTVQDIAYEHYHLPGFLVNIGLAIINSSIKERIHADVFDDLSPYNSGMHCSAPAVFVVAKEDGLVLPKRVQQMHEKYGSKVARKVDKHLLECEGSHTDTRPEAVVSRCFGFLLQQFDRYTAARRAADHHCSDMSRYRRIRGFADPHICLAHTKLAVPFEAPVARLGGYPRPLGSYARGLNVHKQSHRSRLKEDQTPTNHSLQNIFEQTGLPRQKRANLLRSTNSKEGIYSFNKENQLAGVSAVPSEPEAQRPMLHSKLLHQHRLLAQIVENNRAPPQHSPHQPLQQKHKSAANFNPSFAGNITAGNIKLNGNLLSKGLRQFDCQQRSPKISVEAAYHSFASYNPTSRLNSIDISSNVRSRAPPNRDAYSSLNSRLAPQTSSLRNFDEKTSYRSSQYKPLVRPIPPHYFTESLNTSISETPSLRPSNLATTHLYRTNQSTSCFESLRLDRLDDAADSSSYLRLTHGGGKHY